jgi:hypothetical protein
MKRNEKIIKMNPEPAEGGYGLFLIYRKNDAFQNPGSGNEITKNDEPMRTALMHALRN